MKQKRKTKPGRGPALTEDQCCVLATMSPAPHWKWQPREYKQRRYAIAKIEAAIMKRRADAAKLP